jgi:pentapeptide MXKDX repeat protein
MRKSSKKLPGLVFGADGALTIHSFVRSYPAGSLSQNREPNASLRQRETDEDVCEGRDSADTQHQSRRDILMKKSILLTAVVAAGLVIAPLAPAAFADDMKKDSMSKDTMSKDSMAKDKTSKDSMKKKEDMSKDNMSKDGMKK